MPTVGGVGAGACVVQRRGGIGGERVGPAAGAENESDEEGKAVRAKERHQCD
jgi:hypothetical protein